MDKRMVLPVMEPMTLQIVSTNEKSTRRWVGCPALAWAGGRLWAAVYTGGDCEPDPDNYCVVLFSNDGIHWTDPYLTIRSDTRKIRPIDAELFRDPIGRLWLVWGQTRNEGTNLPALYHDGVFGVWASVCERPWADPPVFSEPKRLCDGFMRNKPLFLRNGDWIICAYDFVNPDYSMYRSRDHGESWTRMRGPMKRADYVPTPDETMLVEKADGTLWLLARTPRGIAQSFSTNGGDSWTPMEDTLIPNPSSRFYIGRLQSGRLILINHADSTGRSHLIATLSEDDGATWTGSLEIDERQNVSYPDADQDSTGRIFTIHDRERRQLGEQLLNGFTEADILTGRLISEESFLCRVISRLNE